MVGASFVTVLAWIAASLIALTVWGGAAYLIYWTWRKTRANLARRILGFAGLATFFFVMWAGSRVAP
jgi:uncharacterized membrane protein